jgi:hypothetical protein
MELATELGFSPEVEPTDEDGTSLAQSMMMARFGVDAGSPETRAARLALHLLRRPVFHEVDPEVAELVHSTDLHSLPGEAPRLLREPFLLQVRDPKSNVLFGDTISVGAYPTPDGRLRLLAWEDGIQTSYGWKPTWGDSDLDDGIDLQGSWGLGLTGADGLLTQILRFCVVFGLLLDAENAPLVIGERQFLEASQRTREAMQLPSWRWRTRYISLSRPTSPTNGQGRLTSQELEGQQLRDVMVKGHIKRQRFGKGRQQTRWIYVAAYGARRWIAPGPLKVVVKP